MGRQQRLSGRVPLAGQDVFVDDANEAKLWNDTLKRIDYLEAAEAPTAEVSEKASLQLNRTITYTAAQGFSGDWFSIGSEAYTGVPVATINSADLTDGFAGIICPISCDTITVRIYLNLGAANTDNDFATQYFRLSQLTALGTAINRTQLDSDTVAVAENAEGIQSVTLTGTGSFAQGSIIELLYLFGVVTGTLANGNQQHDIAATVIFSNS